MLSLNTDRFWTIMFTIPLPLVLSSVVAAQDVAADPEPIRIVVQGVMTPRNIDTIFFGHSVTPTIDDAGLILDRAPGLSQTKLCSSDEITNAEIDTQAHHGNDLAAPRPTTLRRWTSRYHDVTRIRSNKFTSFDSQAPPIPSQAIAFGISPKHPVRSVFSGFHSLGHAAKPTLLDLYVTSDTDLALLFESSGDPVAESILIPPNNRRRPQRFRSCIKPIALAQRS